MESELSQLMDLALARGVKHSTLSRTIEDAVLQEYYARYPHAERASVLIDERQGTIHLLSGSRDSTPKEFAADAARIARQTVLRFISSELSDRTEHHSEHESIHVPNIRLNIASLGEWIMRLIFWGYNSLYLFGLVLFVLGTITSSFREGMWETIRTLGFYRTLLLCIAGLSPLAGILIAVRNRMTGTGHKLAAIFFLFELPMVVGSLILINLFFTSERVMGLMIVVFLMIPIVILSHILNLRLSRLRWQLTLYLCQIWVFLGVTYMVLLLSFFLPLILGYFIPSAGGVFDGMFSASGDVWQETSGSWSIGTLMFLPIQLGIVFVGGIFFLFLLSFPFIVPGVFGLIFWRAKTTLAARIGTQLTYRFTALASLTLLVILLALSYQPPVTEHLVKLFAMQSASTYEQREIIARDLLPSERTIKQSLLNMYLARSRYLWTADDTSLARAYENDLDLHPATATFIQQTFLTVAFPFVYRGPTDTQQAASAFHYLFGHPITEETPVPTPTPQVQVVARTIQTTTDYQGVTATVSITEEYTTKSTRAQEIIYEFSLPNAAAVSDLRLGPDLEFTGVIAPRGAAKTTYEQQVTRSRDPALLEEIGPRQYRLRVFPIPGSTDRTTLNGRNQKVQFSYVVGAQPEGYPLPKYSKQQNVDINGATELVSWFNGTSQRLNKADRYIVDGATGAASVDVCRLGELQPWQDQPSSTIVAVIPQEQAIQQSVLDSPKRSCGQRSRQILPVHLRNTRIAILYDTSYNNHTSPFLDELRMAVRNNDNLLRDNQVDLFLFNTHLSQPIRLSESEFPGDIAHFGSGDLGVALRTIPADRYDMLLIALDSHSLPATVSPDVFPHIPVYLLHTDKDIPAYPSALTTYVQEQGQVVDSLSEAFTHFAVTQYPAVQVEKRILVPLSPYYTFTVAPPPDEGYFSPVRYFDAAPMMSGDGFRKLSDRAYFLHVMSLLSKQTDNQLPILDAAHRFAKRARIVTPYSSMLALVNAQQHRMLEQESQQYDRFEDSSTAQPQISPINIGIPRSGGGVFDSFTGFETTNLVLPDPAGKTMSSGISANGMSVGIPRSSYTRITSLPSMLSSLFILVNVILFSVGGIAYAISSFLRWKSHTKK